MDKKQIIVGVGVVKDVGMGKRILKSKYKLKGRKKGGVKASQHALYRKAAWLLLGLVVLLMLPGLAMAGDLSSAGLSARGGLGVVLDRLFEQMIPLAGRLIRVSQVIAGFGALWYIAIRVWRHIARAEPIDFYPLLRPFAIGMAIMLFLPMVHLLNGVLSPTVAATKAMVGDSQRAIMLHIEAEERALEKEAPVGLGVGVGSEAAAGAAGLYGQPDGATDAAGFSASLKSSFSFLQIKATFKTVVAGLMGLLYKAVALCIHTIRTFYLIVLVILGPIVLALSVYDGFQQTLSNWFARYINIYMWLPVANIFGAITSKILENMMLLDQDFFSSTAYILFMIIAVVGYTTVPSVAGYIMLVGGRDALTQKVNRMVSAIGHRH